MITYTATKHVVEDDENVCVNTLVEFNTQECSATLCSVDDYSTRTTMYVTTVCHFDSNGWLTKFDRTEWVTYSVALSVVSTVIEIAMHDMEEGD